MSPAIAAAIDATVKGGARATRLSAATGDCTLHHAGEIVAILERLRLQRTLTTVEFGEGYAIVSSLLELRRDVGAMVFDIARDAEQNRRLFAAQRLSFVAELDSIPITFDTPAASLVACTDGPAALVEFPKALVRLQRREWFRVSLPLDPPIRCTLFDAQGNASPARAVDLSCGGAALEFDDQGGLSCELDSEHELILSLPEIGRIALDARPTSVKPTFAADNATPSRVRIGFRFVAIPAKIASQLQRYVNRVELTRRKG